MVSTQEIPKGYKKTEIGIFPDDWKVYSATQLGEIIDGDRGVNYPSSADFSENGDCLFLNAKNVTKTGFEFDECQFISSGKDSKLGKGKLKRGDIVLTTRGTVGNTAFFDDVVKFDDIRINSGMVIIRTDVTKEITRDYLYKICQSFLLSRQIERFSFGSAQPQLTVKGISAFQFPTPPTKAEQTAIATTLSDVNSLIRTIEQLIAKKRAIKQGAMQELLTGKCRLLGFSGKWETKRLGEICGKITTGKLDANAMVKDGEFRFYTCAKEYCWIDTYAFDTEALLVSGNGANVGYIHYYKGKFNAYQRTYVLYDFYEDIMFIKLFMDRNLQERIRVEVNAGNTPYITMGTLADMLIQVPTDKKEQILIATTINDINSEIINLEQQLAKYKMLKQGMMQALLTGRIRLV